MVNSAEWTTSMWQWLGMEKASFAMVLDGHCRLMVWPSASSTVDDLAWLSLCLYLQSHLGLL